MKNKQLLVGIFSGLLALAIQGQAQTVFQVNFKGTLQTTNSNGDIVSQKLNDQTYLNDAATALGLNISTNGSGTNGVTTTSNSKNPAASLSLVYVQNASSDPSASGDYIEVLEGTNNTPVYTNLLILYGGEFIPALTNSSGTAYVAGALVIPLPLAGSGQSMGGATINEKTTKNGKVSIGGSFNYTALRSASSTSNDVVREYNGTFTVGKQLSP
jgi:hypothetical protein